MTLLIMCEWVCPLLCESVHYSKKRSSATYCSLAPSIFLKLIWMNMWVNMKLSCILISSISKWGSVKVRCSNQSEDGANIVPLCVSNAGASPGLRYHQLPELWEPGGLVQHGEEGQRGIWYPACCLPGWEQKWELHIHQHINPLFFCREEALQ